MNRHVVIDDRRPTIEPPMKQGRRLVGTTPLRWAFASMICGLVYWWFADWWAYVQFPEGPMPKFTVPWWWQAIESGIVGAAGGGLLIGGWWLARWTWYNAVAGRPRA